MYLCMYVGMSSAKARNCLMYMCMYVYLRSCVYIYIYIIMYMCVCTGMSSARAKNNGFSHL